MSNIIDLSVLCGLYTRSLVSNYTFIYSNSKGLNQNVNFFLLLQLIRPVNSCHPSFKSSMVELNYLAQVRAVVLSAVHGTSIHSRIQKVST